jgi:basic amino acid/polyamine antiporter, APA family
LARRCYNAFLHYRNRRRFLGFKRALSPFDATMVVVGGIIGAGIFINPYIVAQRLDSPGLVLAAWIGGGLIAMAGALTFAELGSLFPTAGGHYAYLRDAYHPLFGFLYGWALLFLIEGGAIAAVALTFAEYTFRFLGRADGSAVALAILGILVVTVVNYLGVRPGSRLLNTFVILKVAAIAVLIGAGLVLPGAPEAVDGITSVLSSTEPGAAPGTGFGGGLLSGFSGIFWAMGAALIPIMFSYGGW